MEDFDCVGQSFVCVCAQGDGKRSGNGRCVCQTKYTGTNCSRCQTGYTESVDENGEVICSGIANLRRIDDDRTFCPRSIDIDECQKNVVLSPCLLYKCNNTEGGYECYGKFNVIEDQLARHRHRVLGEPFYRDVPKLSALAIVFLTGLFLIHNQMYGLAALVSTAGCILIVLFVKHLV